MGTKEIEVNTKNEGKHMVSIWTIARNVDEEALASIFKTWINVMGRDYNSGVKFGKHLRKLHRTLQRSMICFLIGAIAGISDQERVDARNETAIATAKKIRDMYENLELPMGPFI